MLLFGKLFHPAGLGILQSIDDRRLSHQIVQNPADYLITQDPIK